MFAEAAFYNNFGICKYFFRQKKYDNDIEEYYFLYSILVKLCVSRSGRRQTGPNSSFSSNIKIREPHRDMKEHINNKIK